MLWKKCRCAVNTQGHRGEIRATSDTYQVIYLQSAAVTLPTIFAARQYVTIHNDGPSVMQIWIDTMPSQSIQLGNGLAGPPIASSLPNMDPAASGIAPNVTLRPGQSVTLAVTSVLLVRALQGNLTGCYVISWCCPMGMGLNIAAAPRNWLESVAITFAHDN